MILGILATVPPQTAQYVQQFLEFHIECARDHARGLLEVTPSVAASAEHPLHDVAVMLIHAHGIPQDLRLDSPLRRYKGACSGELPSHCTLHGELLRTRELTDLWRGKPNWLGGDHFSAALRHTMLVDDHPQTCKYSPRLLPPQYPQDQESVLYHRAGWLTADDLKRKWSALTRQQLRDREQLLLLASKPAMGQPSGQELEGLLSKVLDAPGAAPSTTSGRRTPAS